MSEQEHGQIAIQESGQSQTVVSSLEARQESLLRWLATATVTNLTEQHDAEDLLIAARAALKEAEEKRKELTRPLDESKSRIIALFNPYTDRLTKGINVLTAELGRYHEQKRIEVEAARQTALTEEATRMKEAAETGEILEPSTTLVEPAVPKTSHTHLGSVTYRDDYDIQVIESSKVPRDLCEPSMPKIRARVKSGITNIPGVLITRKVVSTARRGG